LNRRPPNPVQAQPKPLTPEHPFRVNFADPLPPLPDPPKVEEVRPPVVKELQTDGLGYVKFFDPVQVGVTVTADADGVRVAEATEGKPFARAGLRAGDVITAVDGTAVNSTDAFRRLLRKAVALSEPIVLKVRRQEQTREIRVQAKE